MKKGLILALTVIAMVAAVLPAGAVAPIIETLPNVIIGDAGDVTATSPTLHLFRYTNIMNIATDPKIEWGNAGLNFGDAQKHAYYMSTPAGAVKASTNARLVDEVTAADIAALGASGVRPAQSKEITDKDGDGGVSDFFWLSLIDDPAGTTNAYAATPATNGKSIADHGNQIGAANPAVVSLILVDGDFPTTAAAQTDFSVFSVAGAQDGFSTTATPLYTEAFASGAQGWIWKFADPSVAGVVSTPTGTFSNGALTMTKGSDNTKVYFGTWTSGKPGGTAPAPVVDVNAATMAGNIIRATFTLTSTGATAINTPAYRLFYANESFCHLGGVSALSIPSVGTSVVNASAGNPKDIMVYWAVPFGLAEWGDAGKLATVQAGHDFRSYFLTFDMLSYDSATNNGVIGLDNVKVEMIPRPAESAQLVSWGAAPSRPFNGNLAVDGWNNSTQDATVGIAGFPNGLGLGTSTIGAASIVYTAVKTGTDMGYKAAGLFANASALPAWQGNKLIRANIQMACSNVKAFPSLRILHLGVRTNGSPLALTWVDTYSADNSRFLWLSTAGNAAGSPATGTGTLIESYIYTHTAPTAAADAGVIDPQVDCYATGLLNGWPAQNATLTLSKFEYVECAL